MLLRISTLVYLFLLSFSLKANVCELYRDSKRIPHLRITDEKNFSYCFGYMHGRDRAWMMDYFRRTALGKNAEVYGFSHLKGDMMMRLLDVPRIAERLWTNLLPEEKTILETYSQGVNLGFKFAKQTPTQEFLDGYPHPENWKPQDTLMVLILQSFDQTRKTFYVEWLESQVQAKWGEKSADLIDPDGTPWDTTILKTGEYQASTQTTRIENSLKQKSLSQFFASFPSLFGEKGGSNNWVVDATKSHNKVSMLANDPHLDLKTPMFWYWIHLEGPSVDVIGASLPGVPLIVSGANRKMSWGLTNSYLNTADAIFLSNKEDQDKLETFWPLVWVKWGIFKLPIFFKSFQRTQEGFPVLPLQTAQSSPLLLKWSGHHIQSEDIAALRQIMKVRRVDEMDRVISKVGIPSWNFVFTDTFGDIGYRTNGRAFKTEAKHPQGLREGGLEEVTHPEFLTSEEMPHALKPKRGWVVTANNRHWPMDSTFYGGRAYSMGSRAQRIEKLIQETALHDVESFKRIQCDDLATDALYFKDYLYSILSIQKLSPAQSQWLQEFNRWTGETSVECKVCGVYRRLMDLVMEELNLGEIGVWKLAQKSDEKLQASVMENFPRAWDEAGGRAWRDLHINPFAHLSGKEDWVFSPEIGTRGDKHSINPGSSRWNEKKKRYEHYSGASQRLIVEMKSVPEIWLSLPGLNAQYGDYKDKGAWESWERCEYERVEWPLDWASKKIERITN